MTDTERLDWLEQHEALVNTADHPKRGPHVAVQVGEELRHVHRASYRDAIDAAAALQERQPD